MIRPIILFGGNGFIGRHLSVLAHKQSIPGIIVSRSPDNDFLKRHAPSLSSICLADFDAPVGDKVIKQASALVYLACRSVPGTKYETPVTELTDNVVPAFEVFHRAYKLNPSLKGIFISSGGTVYGHSTISPIHENAPLAPISPYGLGKVICEQCVRYCGAIHSNPTTILRVSNAIGRWHRNRTQGVIMAALNAIRSNQPLTVFGDGQQVRDFIDADDVSDAILRVSLSEPGETGTWNVSTGIGHSINDVISIVEALTGKKLKINRVTARCVDVKSVILDPSAFSKKFSWIPKLTLSESIRHILS